MELERSLGRGNCILIVLALAKQTNWAKARFLIQP